jgi:hypothetical protein
MDSSIRRFVLRLAGALRSSCTTKQRMVAGEPDPASRHVISSTFASKLRFRESGRATFNSHVRVIHRSLASFGSFAFTGRGGWHRLHSRNTPRVAKQKTPRRMPGRSSFCMASGDQSCDTGSPPARVLRALRTAAEVLSVRKRTEPSHIAALQPPVWALPIAVNRSS